LIFGRGGVRKGIRNTLSVRLSSGLGDEDRVFNRVFVNNASCFRWGCGLHFNTRWRRRLQGHRFFTIFLVDPALETGNPTATFIVGIRQLRWPIGGRNTRLLNLIGHRPAWRSWLGAGWDRRSFGLLNLTSNEYFHALRKTFPLRPIQCVQPQTIAQVRVGPCLK
jgi:hypothetical protein